MDYVRARLAAEWEELHVEIKDNVDGQELQGRSLGQYAIRNREIVAAQKSLADTKQM